jgi:SDR family mycofactocin-dependent oxidoreductase
MLMSTKVAMISGAARGQGRAHAIRLAQEGYDILAFDICAQVETVAYAMPGRDDLEETADLVKQNGQDVHVEVADVRDPDAVDQVVAAGLKRFGRLDVVVANAGVMTNIGPASQTRAAWLDAIDIMLTGVYNTINSAVGPLIQGGNGGSIVITSSTAGFIGLVDGDTGNAGQLGYVAAKHGVVGLMRAYANLLAPHNIRVNTVHPTGVDTPMILNPQLEKHLETRPQLLAAVQNLLPVDWIESQDVANVVAFLVSDAGRYITGVAMPVDAGLAVRI